MAGDPGTQQRKNPAQEITGNMDTQRAGDAAVTSVPGRNVGVTQQGDFHCISYGQAEARERITDSAALEEPRRGSYTDVRSSE